MKNILLVQGALRKEIAAIDRVYNKLSYPEQNDVRKQYKEMVEPLKDKLFFIKQLAEVQQYAKEKGIDIG